jgi:HK97 family phage major capsid protein
MKTVTETKKTGPQYRFFSVRKDSIDVEKRTVPLAFSSETPYERWFGIEILDHDQKSIRLGRLNDGGAVLLDHDTRKHVGVVEDVTIGEDKIGRAVVRFGRSPEAEAVFQDVQDGIRRHVSVGYFIHRMVLEEKTAEGEQSTETYRATDWEPFEISVVAVPADPTVGIGRAAQQEVQTQFVRSIADEPTSSADGEQPADSTTANTAANIERAIMPDLKNAPAGAAAEVDPVAAEKQRVKDLIAIGEAYGKYIQPKDINDAIANGRSIEQFKDFIMARMQSASDANPGIIVGMTQGDWAKAGLELEASRAVEKIFGRTPEGFYIPADVFRRDFNVGTATEAGNLVATDLRTDLYVDALRAKLVASTLGMRILSGLTSSIAIPRKSTASTLGTLTEIGSASESAPAIAQVSLTPKRVGAYVEYSKQALLQSSMPIENMLRDDLISGAAVLLENGIINGSGTAPQMTGLRNTTGMGTSTGGTAGAAPTWALMVGLETLCAAANAEPDMLAGYLLNTQTRGKLKTVQRGTNLNFIWENGGMPVNGYRVAVTNNVPANLTKGSSTTVCSAALFSSDWSMAVLGLFGAPDVTVDPYSLAATGQVRITLNQFADFGVRQPGAFAKIDDLLSA